MKAKPPHQTKATPTKKVKAKNLLAHKPRPLHPNTAQAVLLLSGEWDLLTIGRMGAEMLALMGVAWPEKLWPDISGLGAEIVEELFTAEDTLRPIYANFGGGVAIANPYVTSVTIAGNMIRLAACNVVGNRWESSP